MVGTSGPFCAGPEYDRGWRSAREDGAELVDEHYYQSPEWFIANHHRYDNFPKGPKVFLGEYASKDNTWFNALAEASYMVGLERNARAVGMACYAPMLCNEEYCSWRPNMIWFNNHQLMHTPNYYVQKLFMEHQGSVLLAQELAGAGEPVKLSSFSDQLAGCLALSGHESTAEFWDIVITNLDTGERMERPESVLCIGNEEHPVSQIDWHNYSISLKAKETDGWKGFHIWFARRDVENKLCWQLGGWNNGDSLISEYVNGKDSVLTQRERHIEKERVYTLEIRVRGRRIETFVDGVKELETEVLPAMVEPLYAVSSRDGRRGDVIVKLVNLLPQKQPVTIELEGMTAAVGTAHIMDGYSRDARNVLGKPETVVPREEQLSFQSGSFEWIAEPDSVCILRLHEAEKM